MRGTTIDKTRLRNLLEEFKEGRLSSKEIEDIFSLFPYEDIIHTKVDHHRPLRKGFPEVIYGKGKSPNQVLEIVQALSATSDKILITKASPEIFNTIHASFAKANYNDEAKTITINERCRMCL